jgi:hypothetical protein
MILFDLASEVFGFFLLLAGYFFAFPIAPR